MVKRNIPIDDYDCTCDYNNYLPCNQEVLAFGVNSLNGLQGDLVLKQLIVGTKCYNGSSDIEITAEDIGLKAAVKYLGAKTKKYIDDITPKANIGDLYFCLDDKVFYLSVGEGDWRHFISGDALKQEIKDRIAGDENLQEQIDSLNTILSDALYDINFLKSGLTSLSERVTSLETTTDDYDARITANESNIAKLDLRTENLARKQVVLDSRVTSLERLVTNVSPRLDALEQTSTTLLNDVENLNIKVYTTDEALNDLAIKVNNVETDTSDLKQKVINLTNKQVVLDRKVTGLLDDMAIIKPEVSKIPVIEAISTQAKDIADEALYKAEHAEAITEDVDLRIDNLARKQVTLDLKVSDLQKTTVKKITTVDRELAVDENNNITLQKADKSNYGLVKLGNEFIDREEVLTLNEVSTDKIIQGSKSILIQAVDE